MGCGAKPLGRYHRAAWLHEESRDSGRDPPSNQIQAEWRDEHEDSLKEFAQAKEEYDLRRQAWKEQFKSNTKKKKNPPDRPDDAPEQPTLRRLIVNDATFEALHQTMSENPDGILVIRDELTGWWSTLDRAGREGERAFCLQAWNGDTGHTIDRIARGTVHVEACCMSMLGGIWTAPFFETVARCNTRCSLPNSSPR